MDTFRIQDSGWIVIGGILLLILSIVVLINPLGAGVDTVIILSGIGLIVFGALLCMLSMKLKDIHKHFDSLQA